MTRDQLTSSALNDSVDLLLAVHGSQVEGFDSWSALKELRRVIWRWSELLQHLSPHASRRLLLVHHRAVSEVALYEKDHLFIPHKDVVGAHYVEPPLDGSLRARLILVGANAGAGGGWRDCGDQCFRAGGCEMRGQLLELVVGSTDIAVLCGPELGQGSLSTISS